MLIFEKEKDRNNITNTEFLDLLYKGLLKRDPDQEGFDAWLEQLEKGLPREKVIYEFIESEEYLNIISVYDIKN